MVVEIALRDHAYGQEWNIPGAGIISGKEIVRLARLAAGTAKPVIPLGRLGLTTCGDVCARDEGSGGNAVLDDGTSPPERRKVRAVRIGPIPATATGRHYRDHSSDKRLGSTT